MLFFVLRKTMFNFWFYFFNAFFLDIMYLFLERGEGREKEGEKHQCVITSCTPLTGDLACNPGMCPDWEFNQQPFGSQPALNPLNHTSQGCSMFRYTKVQNPPPNVSWALWELTLGKHHPNSKNQHQGLISPGNSERFQRIVQEKHIRLQTQQRLPHYFTFPT